MSNIRDLVAYDSGAGLRLYMLAADGGSLSVYDPAAGMALLEQVYFQAGATAGAMPRLELDESTGPPALLVTGGSGTGVQRFELDANGLPGPVQVLASPASGFVASEWVDTGAVQVLFTSSTNQGGIACWMDNGQGGLSLIDQVNLGAMTGGIDIQSMTQISRNGETFLLLASAQANQLIALRVNADGSLRMTGQITSGDGFWIDTPSAVTAASIGGVEYVLMAASGTSSVVVARLEADGSFTITDQVNDDLTTRFEHLTVLESIEIGGQVFVVAGGADDGLSLFSLTPEGRLVHRQSIADSTEMALTNITAVSLAVVDGQIEIFASGEGATEVTWLRVDPGALGAAAQPGVGDDVLTGTAGGDMLAGGTGNDQISGGAGDDILIDGGGADIMTGGAGADVFIFSRDDDIDVVTDFQPGIDRLDLSGIGRAYTLSALTFTPLDGGVRIAFAGQIMEIYSASGQSLDAGDFTTQSLFDLWHVVNDTPVSPPPGLIKITGNGGSNVLVGGAEDNLLNGEFLDPAYDLTYARVFRLYQATLDRAPDLAGLVRWAAELDGGRALVDVVTGFVNSAEFQATYGSTDNTQFVTLLYQNVLDRAPDAGGLAHWEGLLSDGSLSREQVVLGFSESAEFIANTAGSSLEYSWSGLKSDWSDNVFRLYQATLDRVPDLGGLAHWAGQLAGGRALVDVVTGFVNSAEFQATYGATDNTQFVTLLYQNVLDRAPDAGGLAHWVGRLNDGSLSREQVVLGFSESAEFIRNSDAAVIDYMRGLGMQDRLVGGAGDNILFGGWRADTFVFNATEAATDTVIGLEAWDVIELQQSTFVDAGAVLAALTQTAEGVTLVDGATSILFAGTDLGDFSADMFGFV